MSLIRVRSPASVPAPVDLSATKIPTPHLQEHTPVQAKLYRKGRPQMKSNKSDILHKVRHKSHNRSVGSWGFFVFFSDVLAVGNHLVGNLCEKVGHAFLDQTAHWNHWNVTGNREIPEIPFFIIRTTIPRRQENWLDPHKNQTHLD